MGKEEAKVFFGSTDPLQSIGKERQRTNDRVVRFGRIVECEDHQSVGDGLPGSGIGRWFVCGTIHRKDEESNEYESHDKDFPDSAVW